MSTTLIRTQLTLLGLLAAAAFTGCGTDPVTADVQVREDVVDQVCVCPGAILQPSEAACREEMARVMQIPTESQKACMHRVYDDHSAELNPVLDCRHDAGLALVDCLESALVTCPPPLADSTACTSTYVDALEACPTPSNAAQTQLTACFAS